MQPLPPGARLHPWNESFAWKATPGPYRVLTAAQAGQFDALGYVVLDGVISAAEIERVVTEIDPIEAQTEAFLRAREDERFFILEAGAITFSAHLVARSRLLRTFAAHPVFAGLCADLIGPAVTL